MRTAPAHAARHPLARVEPNVHAHIHMYIPFMYMHMYIAIMYMYIDAYVHRCICICTCICTCIIIRLRSRGEAPAGLGGADPDAPARGRDGAPEEAGRPLVCFSPTVLGNMFFSECRSKLLPWRVRYPFSSVPTKPVPISDLECSCESRCCGPSSFGSFWLGFWLGLFILDTSKN